MSLDSLVYAVMVGLTWGFVEFQRQRRASTPLTPAVVKGLKRTAILIVIGLLYELTLKAAGVARNSLAGWGIGLLLGFVALAVVVQFERRSRRDWQ